MISGFHKIIVQYFADSYLVRGILYQSLNMKYNCLSRSLRNLKQSNSKLQSLYPLRSEYQKTNYILYYLLIYRWKGPLNHWHTVNYEALPAV